MISAGAIPPVAVVTGGSAGVGRAVVRRLAECGFDVAVLARGAAGLDAAADDVRARGRRALTAATDVADHGAVEAAAARVAGELGPIGVWVNNAMTTVFSWSWDISAEEFRRVTEVSYLGQVHGTLCALRHMRPRNQGRIVNVGSSLSYVGIPLQSAYCAAKFAARGFTDSVRAELAGEGSAVTVSMVHLPAVDTPQFDWCRARLHRRPRPVAPVYAPELAARRIVATALDGRGSPIVGSWNRLVVAGARFAPGALARYAAATAVDAQQGEEPAEPRPGNLWDPGDAHCDAGAGGSFAAERGGVLNRRFLASLPATTLGLLRAVARR